MRKPIVAIDGPAGSGKSTVAKGLAKRLSFVHIDTGALYRGVALLALEKNSNLSREQEIVDACKGVTFHFQQTPEGNVLFLNDRNVGRDIRTEQVSVGASQVSVHPGVRQLLLGLQRDLGKSGGVVMEGRDIGTVIFPHAEVKIFLTASIQERAKRRAQELAAKGQMVDIKILEQEMAQRDTRDSSRAEAPLTQAPDAILVDTSCMSIESVLDRLESIVRNVK